MKRFFKYDYMPSNWMTSEETFKHMLGFKLKLILVALLFGLFLVIGTIVTNHYMLKTSLIEYVDQRDQQHLERIKKNLQHVLTQRGESDLSQMDEVTWKNLVGISSRVDFAETMVPAEVFLFHPFSEFKRFHPDYTEQRLSLMNTDRQCIFGNETSNRTLFLPIELNNQKIGYIGYAHREELTESLDIQLEQRQRELITYSVAFLVLITGLLLLPIAHYFIHPILAVTQGMRALTAGRFDTRLKVNRRDELGQLLQDFNHLSKSLEKNQQSRNQWIADISHELRTPLTIIRGDIEAMKDGVRQLNQQTLDNLHSEVVHLNRLIDDLYQIALNDVGGLRYQMHRVNFTGLVNSTLANFRQQADIKGLKLYARLPEQDLYLLGDSDRLQQMLANLLANSIAYTDAPGEIHLTLTENKKVLHLVLEDTAPSVSEEAMQHLFERFYRAEGSRNRRFGGAGIGLALVQQIAQAHQGDVTVSASHIGGLKFTLTLPQEAYAS